MRPATANLDDLPPPLPSEQIVALNRPKKDLHTHRNYAWNGWDFDVPPGVFMPGATSRMIHERLLAGTIDVRGRNYAAMGIGLGVETVVAAMQGARQIYAIDVDPASVVTAQEHVARILGPSAVSTLVPMVCDLFDAVPRGAQFDVITFNPPAVNDVVSRDSAVVRNVCEGAPIVQRFFAQIVERDLLAPDGEIFLVISNTADLRTIIGNAGEHRLRAEVAHRHDWDDGVVTFVFRLQQES